MLRSTAEDLLERRLMSLWPRWKPTGAQREEWLLYLASLEYDDANYAIGKAFQESRYGAPRIADLRPHVQLALARRAPGERAKEDAGGFTATWVVCVEAPQEHPGRIGWVVPVVFGSDDSIPGNPDKIARAAERIRARHEQIHGGAWQVYRGLSWPDVAKLRNELRQAAESRTA